MIKLLTLALKTLFIFIVVFLLCIEAYYHYLIKQLQPTKLEVKQIQSQMLMDIMWVDLESHYGGLFERTVKADQQSIEAYTVSGLLGRFILQACCAKPNSTFLPNGFNVTTRISSLINHQLPKKRDSLRRHADNLALSVWLSQHSDIQTLIDYILNQSYFGYRATTFAEVANLYFDKTVHELNINEIITLVSISRAPSAYTPHICDKEKQLSHLKRLERQGTRLNQALTRYYPQKYQDNHYDIPNFSSYICKTY